MACGDNRYQTKQANTLVTSPSRHDTVEDTETSIDDIRLEFGEDVANIVAEVTDDKSLTKLERKRQQIEHAMQASKQAKLVKLADKLYNLKDIQKSIPSSWTVERAQAYFGWSQEVINQLRGTNEPLERELEKVLGGVITHNGHQIPCLPPGYQPGDWEKNTPSH